MAPKKPKGKVMNLEEFAGKEYRAQALPTASEGVELNKGKGKHGGGDRYGDRGGGYGDRGGGSRFGGNRNYGGDREDEGGSNGIDNWRGSGGFGDRGGKGGDRDNDRGGGFRRRTNNDDDAPNRADEGEWRSRGDDNKDKGTSGFERRDRLNSGAGFENENWRAGGNRESESKPDSERRPRLNLKPRTKPVEENNTPTDDAPASRQNSETVKKSNPFGSAAPVDIEAKMSKSRGNQETSNTENWRGSSNTTNNNLSRTNSYSKGKGHEDRPRHNTFDSTNDDSKEAISRDFSNLRRGGNNQGKGSKDHSDRHSNRKNHGKDKESNEDQTIEENEDGWNMVSLAGKQNKTVSNSKEEDKATQPKVVKSRFDIGSSSDEAEDMEENSSSEESVEEEIVSEPKVSGDTAGEPKESDTAAKSNSNVSTNRSVPTPTQEKAAPRAPVQSSGKAYVPPALAAKQKEDEQRQARIAADRKAREEKQQAERSEREKQQEEKKKKDEIQREVEQQKLDRKQRGMEEAIALKKAAENAKAEAMRAKQQKREEAKFRRIRFTPKAYNVEKVSHFDEALSKSFGDDGNSLDASDFNVKHWFADHMEYNIYYAIMSLTRIILHNAYTVERLTELLKLAKPIYSKLFVDGGLTSKKEEILYAATFVLHQMRNEKQQLPDYSVDAAVVESFFYQCYSTEIVTEEEILRWFDDEDDEIEGRMDCGFQLQPLLNFFRNPRMNYVDLMADEDEEDSEEESDDEELEGVAKMQNFGMQSIKKNY